MSIPAELIGIAPQLLVNNVVKTAEYYQNTLGFTLINYVGNPPVYAMLQRNGFQIHFAGVEGKDIKPNEQLRKDVCDFIIWVPEIDKFFEEVKSSGADIVQDIVTRPYGSREFIIRDCNGYRILVGD